MRLCGAQNLLHGRSLIPKWISSHIMVSNCTVLTNILICRHIWSSRKLAMMLLYLKVYTVRGSDIISHEQIKFQNCKALWKMSKAVHLIFMEVLTLIISSTSFSVIVCFTGEKNITSIFKMEHAVNKAAYLFITF